MQTRQNTCALIKGDISTLKDGPLKLMDKFTYLGRSILSTESNINTRLAKAWTAINRLSVIQKSDQTDKIKYSFFQEAVLLILLYGCTTWMLTKRMEKKLDSNYTRMLQAVLKKLGSNIPQNSNSMATYDSLWKLSETCRTLLEK